MIFSKSFGYALRGILYIALVTKDRNRVQVDEIARELIVPKHFLSKILKNLVKHGILNSTKGPYGGFTLSEKTFDTSLFELIQITNGDMQLGDCVLRLRKCNADHPCPLHDKMLAYKGELQQLFTGTMVGDLLATDQPDFIKSISTL